MPQKITYELIEKTREKDINLPNEPFSLIGKMIPRYTNEEWSFVVEKAETITDMCFPDEEYVYDDMSETSYFIGAYDNGKCVGLAIMQQAFFKHMYLYDLKVKSAYRGKGIGEGLIQACQQLAVREGYLGIYTQGQDNNLSACLFYIKTGFTIGGLDTCVYKGTSQENKKDIYFYLEC